MTKLTLPRLLAFAEQQRDMLKGVFEDLLVPRHDAVIHTLNDNTAGDVALLIPFQLNGADGALAINLYVDGRARAGAGVSLHGKPMPVGPPTELTVDQPYDWQGWAFEAKTFCDDIRDNGGKSYMVKQGQFGLANGVEFNQHEAMMVYVIGTNVAILPVDISHGWQLMPKTEFDALVAVGVLEEDE